MKKPIIGIIAQSQGFKDNSVFIDRYYILDNYSKIINKYSGIPIGIIFDELKVIPESLSICDAFLLTGGIRIDNYHLEIIDFAIKNKIPILGICCGMQAMAMYSLNEKKEANVLTKINSSIEHDYSITKENKNLLAHDIYLTNNDNWLYKIYQKDIIPVNSYHNFKVSQVGKKFEIIAKSLDNIIEAIEYKDKSQFVLGVQWHPELLEDEDKIIKIFMKEAKKYHENKYRKYKFK